MAEALAPKGDVSTPDISVVIPTYDREDQLANLLEALACQDFPSDRFEIIVVDDGGHVPLAPLVARSKLHVRLLQQANQGCAIARNAGALASTGELLVFTDDDCRPDPDWLSALWAAHQDCPTALLGNPVNNALTENLYAEASQRLLEVLHAYDRSHRPAWQFVTGNNLAMSRSLFAEIGGFAKGLPFSCGEDREICHRWRAAGYPMSLRPEAVVWHHHDLGFRTFFRQHFNYGRSAQLLREPTSASEGAPAPSPLFFLRLLFRSSGRPVFNELLVRGLLIVSQVATVSGMLRTRLDRKHERVRPSMGVSS